MHYLHIFNTCYVTDVVTNETMTYLTRDFSIELKEICPFPKSLYELTITTKKDQASILDDLTTPEGNDKFICDCVLEKETENELVLSGYVPGNSYYKIVINKSYLNKKNCLQI